jgi:hypothetical protein
MFRDLEHGMRSVEREECSGPLPLSDLLSGPRIELVSTPRSLTIAMIKRATCDKFTTSPACLIRYDVGIGPAVLKMNWPRCVLYFCAFWPAAGFLASPASAQTRVGEAAVVQNVVVRVMASATSPINVGDGVLRDEIVRTGVESAARLVMADSTNLSLGPNATIKLDRTVFDGEHSYRDIAIRLTSGVFRFVTGHSEKTAYKITTPLATIGVRGTVLDILSQRGETIIVLQEGASRVCTRSGQCIELTQPGDTAVIASAGGKIRIQKTNVPPWTFASTCAAATGLCTVTDYAEATPAVTPVVDDGSDPTGMLCGR